MFVKKPPLTLTLLAIAFLSGFSYGTLASDANSPTETLRKGVGLPAKKGFKADDSWIKNPQKATSQEAADKARNERIAEMGATIPAAKEDQGAKPAPRSASTPQNANATDTQEPGWLKLAKQRRAERLEREKRSQNLPLNPSTPEAAVEKKPGTPTDNQIPSSIPSKAMQPSLQPTEQTLPSLLAQIQQGKQMKPAQERNLKPTNDSDTQSPAMKKLMQQQEKAS